MNCLKSHKPSTENKKQKLSPEHLNGVKKEGNISFHNYCKTNKNGQKACQKKKNKKLKFSDFYVFQEVNKEVASIEFQNFFSIDDDGAPTLVSNCCIFENSDFNDQKIDYLSDSNHIRKFEEEIRQSADFYYMCCERFLFSNHIYHLSQAVSLDDLQINQDDNLCKFCCTSLSKQQIPYLSCKSNNLNVSEIPAKLQCLSLVERILIALVQIFMSLLILPGG